MSAFSFSKHVRGLAFSAMLAFIAEDALGERSPIVIEVRPRIGLFNEVQFHRNADPVPAAIRPVERDGWRPWSQDDYTAKAEQALKAMLTIGSWDLLTTDPAQQGYRKRRFHLQLVPTPGVKHTNCALRFTDPRGAEIAVTADNSGPSARYEAATCDINTDFTIESNERIDVTLRSNRDGAPYQAKARIPEDFLIVSLGDSYGSGEGNPDSWCVGGFLGRCRTGPIWMDERCHRSGFAATIQAALALLRSEHGIESGHHGAITVVSLACSGATITDGIVGPYQGAITLTELRKNNAHLGLIPEDTQVEEGDTLPDQITALRAFLDRQNPGAMKRYIDVVSISVGGNDVLFGAALSDLIRKRQSAQTLEQLEEELNAKIQRLKEVELPKVASRFGELRSIDRPYRIGQTLYSEYPDPTRVTIEPEVFCSSVPADGLLGSIAGAAGYKLTAEDTKFAFRVVVRGLSDVVAHAATTFDWRAVNGFVNNRDLVGRGWCAEASEDYAGSQQRWFRKVDESVHIQADIHGAMHPTYEMHAYIGTRLNGLISAGSRLQLEPRIQSGSSLSGNLRVMQSPLRLAVYDGDTKSVNGRRVCVSGAGMKETCNRSGEFSLAHDAPSPTVVRIFDDDTGRWFENEIPSAVVDDRPPRLSLCNVLKARGDALPCASAPWLGAGDKLFVEFEDQGKAGVEKLTWLTYAADTRTVSTDAPRDALNPLELDSEMAEGRHLLKLGAVDAVGNSTSAEDPGLSFPINVDRTAPDLVSLQSLGHEFAGSPPPYVVPVTIGESASLSISAADLVSGVQAVTLIVLPGTEKEFRVGTSQDAALEHCRRAGRDDILQRLDIPIDFAVAQTTGGTSEAIEGMLRAVDCAENKKNIPIVFRKLPRANAAPRPPEWWKANRQAIAPLLARVRGIAGNGAVPPPTDDDPAWPIAAGWLNVSSGALNPAAILPIHLNRATCAPESDGAMSTVFSVLKIAQVCLDTTLAANPEGRGVLLNAITPPMQALYTPNLPR